MSNDSLDSHGLWRQGRFIDSTEYDHWSPEMKKRAQESEKRCVRPSEKGNAICLCENPDDAEWIASRLNRAAELEEKIKTLREQLEEALTCLGS